MLTLQKAWALTGRDADVSDSHLCGRVLVSGRPCVFQGATEACFSLSEPESLSLSGMLAPLTIDGSHSHSPRNLQTYKNSTYNLGIYTPSDVCHRFSRGF